MENCIYLIEQLSLRLSEMEKENNLLKQKISNYEGKLEILNDFYSNFKNNEKGLEVRKNNNIIKNNPKLKNYDSLLSDYFVEKDSKIIDKLFSEYNEKPSKILTDIRMLSDIDNVFPENIKDIVKKYDCENEFEIIETSVSLIKKHKYTGKGTLRLSNLYIENYISGKKKNALKFLKEALIVYPFDFDKFMHNIREYQDNNLLNYVEKLKVELYGENNILLNDKGDEKNDVKTHKNNVKEKSNRGRKSIDFKNIAIDELLTKVKKSKNKRQTALRYSRILMSLDREDVFTFIDEVNKFLTKKISDL